ncbi:sensor histidine kinase [Rufibacter latericius]|uniref:histidine kinase n=1 Tax=Rufibacter latericius TaxID=2487040 RepID=A0A3M9MPS7_9BACT|nr:sensor histidine kinase [Rufibacter latericius]RNI26883.1 GHKL domain-containing protein [Rufibacter latericius]
MDQPITTIKLQNELDVVLAYKRAMQLSEFSGLPTASQTKFATAVSEICRNVLEHVGNGTIRYSMVEHRGILSLEAFVTDRGRGIPNVSDLLRREYMPTGGKGQGIYSSRKLVDLFQIESDFEKGTRVRLQKRIPSNHPPINKAIIQGWAEYFNTESEISPYAEIKRQNMQLIELMEQLRVRTIEAEYQLQEIQHLNQELQTSNQEINALLQERETKNHQLEKVNKTLDEFAHTVTHDLKAPLQNILGLTDAVTDYLGEGNSTEAQEVLPMIQAQARRMEHLITDVLAYSLTGRQQIQTKLVPVRQLVENVLTTLTIPVGFRIHVPNNLPVVEAEEIYLQQIFSNLLNNALKYHDQPVGNIWIKATEQDSHWEFVVEDDGPGIPLENQEKVFELFETTSDVNRPDSTGIGLAIVRKIMQEKEGRVWIRSQGRGTAMHFTWPLASESLPKAVYHLK